MAINKFRVAAHTPCTRTTSWANIDVRVNEMVENIEIVAGLMDTDSVVGTDELHIFAAPEWSFQRSLEKQDLNASVNTFHRMKDLDKVIDAMKTVSQQFPRMLMIPGSVLWAIPHPFRREGYLVYNTVFAFYGGNLVHTYHKSTWGGDSLGGGTFGTNTGNNAFGNIMRTSYEDSYGKSHKTNSHFFTVDGRGFGVEVCADHTDSLMLSEYKEEYRNGNGVDFHIVISCGVQITTTNVAARQGGFVIHSDGFFEDSSDNDWGMNNKDLGLVVRKVTTRIGGISRTLSNECTLAPPPPGHMHKRFIRDQPIAKRLVVDKTLYRLK